MIKEIQFHNFKVLKDTILPLGRFTLIVGPNGSGKSTALHGIEAAGTPKSFSRDELCTAECDGDVVICLVWKSAQEPAHWIASWNQRGGQGGMKLAHANGTVVGTADAKRIKRTLKRFRTFQLDPLQVARSVRLAPQMELDANGFGLTGVLDRLRDQAPERFDGLNRELNRWLPEFDRVLFDVPTAGERSFSLRTASGYVICATDLSQGTLLALAILTVAYLPDPPPLVAFEDPDRGIHPRLLREFRDALYRLAYPENFGDERDPVQVIATTHSPYFLDLFRDHPEEIVIAERRGDYAIFERLIDRKDIEEILEDASLGEVWYSGVLGGVPAEP